MQLAEYASDAFNQIKDTLSKPAESAFFTQRKDLEFLLPAASAVGTFISARPVMAIVDAYDKNRLFNFMLGERKEAEQEADRTDALRSEIGDTIFFATLSGVLHWEYLDETQQKVVIETIGWACDRAKANDFDPVESVVYVAEKKNTINHREEIYQIDPAEKTTAVLSRFEKIYRMSRQLRAIFNGHWMDKNAVELMRETREKGEGAPEFLDLIDSILAHIFTSDVQATQAA